MSSQPISTDMHRVYYSLADACFCSSVLLFFHFILVWWVGGGGHLYMPPPTCLFQDQGGLSFPPSVSHASLPFLSPLRLSQLSAHSPIAQDVKSAYTSPHGHLYQQSCTIWVCPICFLLCTPIRAVSNTESIKVHYQWAGSLDSWASYSICPDDLPNDSAKCLVKLHTAALGCFFFRARKDQEFILPRSLHFVMDGWSVATLSQHCNCLIFGWLPVWTWNTGYWRMASVWETACAFIATLTALCGY